MAVDPKFFLHQMKHNVGGNFDKGIVVKDTYEAAKQGYHAYLGAYAYGQHSGTDYVQCAITDMTGRALMSEVWYAPEPEPEPEPEPDAEEPQA